MPNDSPSLELRRVLFSNVPRDIYSKHLDRTLFYGGCTQTFFSQGGRSFPAQFSDVDHGLTP